MPVKKTSLKDYLRKVLVWAASPVKVADTTSLAAFVNSPIVTLPLFLSTLVGARDLKRMGGFWDIAPMVCLLLAIVAGIWLRYATRRSGPPTFVLCLCFLFFAFLAIISLSANIYATYFNRYVTITWPNKEIYTNIETVSGNLINFPEDKTDLEVKLYVRPLDGNSDGRNTKYFLDRNSPSYRIDKDGWYGECRFGDEFQETLRGKFPLQFAVYAVVIRRGTQLPLDDGKLFLSADTEEMFRSVVERYALAVSSTFLVTRVAPPQLPPYPTRIEDSCGMSDAIEPPKTPLREVCSRFRIGWEENVPMYLEILHGAEVLEKGYAKPDDEHVLVPDALYYELKLSRREGFPQSSLWLRVVGSADRPGS